MITLKDGEVTLRSLATQDRESVFAALQDPRVYELMPLRGGESREAFAEWWKVAEQNVGYAFAVFRGEKLVGSTRLMNWNSEHETCEIGHTWYVHDEWGTDLNPRCKRMLLRLAFDGLNLFRVQFRIDSRNARSRAAVEKLGAKCDGIIRAEMLLKDGVRRDTVIYSILKPEWPEIQSRLQSRLSV